MTLDERIRREDRREARRIMLANWIAIRDAAFWWGGVWAMMTALDLGVVCLCRAIYRRRKRRRMSRWYTKARDGAEEKEA